MRKNSWFYGTFDTLTDKKFLTKRPFIGRHYTNFSLKEFLDIDDFTTHGVAKKEYKLTSEAGEVNGFSIGLEGYNLW